uniref:Leucine-rich repeat-containing protein 28 n=2 Tax=Clastoptera arizonana TaxID=38151 RepID=A0A1B6E2U8_9HEMI
MEKCQTTIYFEICNIEVSVVFTRSYVCQNFLNKVNKYLMDKEIIKEIANKNILHWNYRDWCSVPRELQEHGKDVEEIYLRYNDLLLLPVWFCDLTNLTNLYLAGNGLLFVPNNICDLYKLKTLELSHNQIKYLPENIVTLVRLNYLLIDNNLIGYLPDDIGRLTALYTFHINDNKIKQLPPSLSACVSLRELCMHNNQLTTIPSGVVSLPNLEIVTLHRNNLLYLPPVGFNLRTKMTIYDNPHLNYLTFPVAEMIMPPHYTLQDFETHFICGCGGLNQIEDFPNLSNTIINVVDYNSNLIMPVGITKVCSDFCVPSLNELSLRNVFNLLKSDKSCDLIREIPACLQYVLMKGPSAECSVCKLSLFKEVILWVFLHYNISNSSKFYSVTFLCSSKCALYLRRTSLNYICKVRWVKLQ